MALKSKTFLVKKGENLDSISSFLYSAIGLDAYLIKGIESTALNETVTQLSVIYQEFPDFVIDSIAPRPGAIIPTGAVGSAFDSRVLFNTPVDPNSFTSGVFVIDGVGLATNKFSVRSGTNNYYVKVNLNGYTASGFHELRIDSSKFKKIDGTYFDYSPVAGYTFNSLASSHLGDKLEPYVTRRRGLVKADFIKLSKGVSPQQSIQEYLTQRGLDKEKLVTYTFSSRVDNTIDVFFIYISELEPQILEGYPLTNTLIPNQATLTNLTLVFNTKLDKSQLTTTNGIFSIETDYNTTVPILASDVTVLSDLKTVRLALPSYISADRIYSIVVNVGLKSLQGVVKQKPEQWVLHITEYRGSVGSISIGSTGGSGAAVDAYYVLSRPNTSLPNSSVLTGVSGISITLDGVVTFSGNLYSSVNSHLTSTSNPHSTTAAQVGAPTVAQFTGLTGTVVYTNNNGLQVISGQLGSSVAASDPAAFVRLNESQSGDLASIAYTNILVGVVVAHTSDFNNPHNTTAAQVGAPTTGNYGYLSGLFNTHTGNTGIHFTQSQISIPSSQIYDFSGAVVAITSSLSGVSNTVFTGHTGDTTIHFTQSQISIPSTQISDFTEAAQDAVGNSITSFSGITATYADASNTINFSLSGWLYTGITGHIGSTSNPHGTTAAQVGAPTTGNYSYLSGLYNTHQADTTIHYTVDTIDHRNLLSIGSNSHSAIDNHISDTTIHYTTSTISITPSQVVGFTGSAFSGAFRFATGISGISLTTGTNSLTVAMSGWLYTGITGHIGDSTIHFTQSQISIPYTQISNFVAGVNANAPTIAQFTGHTGAANLHFTQAQISIPSTQISDFTEAAQDVFGAVGFIQFGSGISGNYNDAGNSYTLSGRYATTSTHGVSLYNSAHFAVANGNVSLVTPITILDDVPDVKIIGVANNDTLVWNSSQSNWVNTGASVIALTPANNLSDVSNVDTARKNLKLRYQIEDFAPYNYAQWTNASIGGNAASYNYDPYYYSLIRTKDCQGVMVSSNGAGTGAGDGTIFYQISQGFWPASGMTFYFRVIVANTGQAFYRVGMLNAVPLATGDIADGFYFEYNSANNTNWLVCQASGSNRIKSATTVAPSDTVFKWLGIEITANGSKFYDFDTSGTNPIKTFLNSESYPGIQYSYLRPFMQCIGNGVGATYRGIFMDKFAYPIFESSLPSGLV